MLDTLKARHEVILLISRPILEPRHIFLVSSVSSPVVVKGVKGERAWDRG